MMFGQTQATVMIMSDYYIIDLISITISLTNNQSSGTQIFRLFRMLYIFLLSVFRIPLVL